MTPKFWDGRGRIYKKHEDNKRPEYYYWSDLQKDLGFLCGVKDILPIETIPNDPCVNEVKFSPPYSTICSVGNAPFWGTVDIVYEPKEKLLELESFQLWLRSLSNERMTVEDLCRLCFDKLMAVLGDIRLRVTVNANTTVHAPISATIKTKEGEK